MILIPECRLCGQEELAPDCLMSLQICGTCWLAPNRPGFNLDYTGRIGRVETLVYIQNLRKNNICFEVGSTGAE